MEELIKEFSMERCSKSGAKFDFEKGKWFNHQYLQLKPIEELAAKFKKVLEAKGVVATDETITSVIALMRERINFISELWDTTSYFFVAPTGYDEKSVQKRWKPFTAQQLTELSAYIETLDTFVTDKADTEAKVMEWIAAKEYKTGDVMNAFRIALVGESKGPHIFDLTTIIGKEETLRRIQQAINTIQL
jgi:glutamyl-tRNA synthetase